MTFEENEFTDWKYKGEVEGRERPKGSLLNQEIQFDQTKPLIPILEENFDIRKVVIERIKERKYDNWILQKKEENINEGIEDNEENKDITNIEDDNLSKEEMRELFSLIDKQLLQITDYKLLFCNSLFYKEELIKSENEINFDKNVSESEKRRKESKKRSKESKDIKKLRKIRNVTLLK
ncbi:hypothetical protein CWI39_3079p0010 [Hamiltosporidium magnivora]|uniref:Uncharacterized protein n=1 Tax=Hamiltosporidium magnivora TaxID=148818 RepID=A0A4Q9KRZ9_9MICR|nr:hypothetical protein CWI39_3079p0010 [Hamiltosporidium magnivora]